MDLPAPAARRAGPRREFVELYRTELAFVWRALLRLGVTRSDCDDATQDVFVTAHRRWATLRDGERRRAWLFGIVRRVAWRHRRSRARHDRRVEAWSHSLAPTLDVEGELARIEAWRALSTFLDSLDEQKRAVFVLGELEELGRTEIGAVLGINPNTAQSRLQAARRAFFAFFAGYDDDHVAQLLARASLATEMPPDTARRTWAAIALAVGAPVKSIAIATIAAVASSIAIAVGIAATRDDPQTVDGATVATSPHSVPDAPQVGPITSSVDPVRSIEATAPAGASRIAPLDRSDRAVRRGAVKPMDPRTVDDEVAILVAARSALRRGDLGETRRRLDAHSETFGATASLLEVRAQIERDLAAASIDPRPSGDSIGVEQHQ